MRKSCQILPDDTNQIVRNATSSMICTNASPVQLSGLQLLDIFDILILIQQLNFKLNSYLI